MFRPRIKPGPHHWEANTLEKSHSNNEKPKEAPPPSRAPTQSFLQAMPFQKVFWIFRWNATSEKGDEIIQYLLWNLDFTKF
jgi:hypothetical protein